jgi:hypothetical protein
MQPDEVSLAEINGRIVTLTQQRDAATNFCVIQGGQLAQLRERVMELEKENGELRQKLGDAGVPS